MKIKTIIEYLKSLTGLFWIDSSIIPPNEDVPILIAVDYEDFPLCHRYQKYQFGHGFYDSKKEYMIVAKDIQFWRKAPKMPFFKTITEFQSIYEEDQ